jgi:L-seryl-tRNA(Ser) seleniumtransferase
MGRKNLVKAAWPHSAPHRALGRRMKVGKEEIIGMLAAVELLMQMDREAEWKQREGWLDSTANHLSRTQVFPPSGEEQLIQWSAGACV